VARGAARRLPPPPYCCPYPCPYCTLPLLTTAKPLTGSHAHAACTPSDTPPRNQAARAHPKRRVPPRNVLAAAWCADRFRVWGPGSRRGTHILSACTIKSASGDSMLSRSWKSTCAQRRQRAARGRR